MANVYLSTLAVITGILLFVVGCKRIQDFPEASNAPRISFGLSEVRMATLSDSIQSPKIRIELIDSIGPQAYELSIQKRGKVIIAGGDSIGIMYGLMDLAAQIRHSGSLEDLKNSTGKPYLERRGLKFNIPLDARTPSFDDTGDAAQNNIETIWDMKFWEEFLDDMARYRYNTLTLWTPNPFPSMIEIPDMPGASLEDICKTTLKPHGKHGEWAEPTMVSVEVMENLEVVKKMSIGEKIKFWQGVMRHARNRGIDIFFITWNIAPNSLANPVPPYYKCWLWNEPLEEDPGKYGVSHDIYNSLTIEYYRKAVKTFIQTYPDLKGIGVTSGEHMPRYLDDVERERWLWNTYGLGILDALEEEPDREIDFIHRMWWTNMDNVMKFWDDYPGKFDLSFKYSRARLYSDPIPGFADNLLPILEEYDLKSWWNLRNDDIFLHRWGDPEFVRSLFRNLPKDLTAGYHMGSDGYVWGKNSSDLIHPGQLEIKKHWYKFMLWGMLGYDPEMNNDFFIQSIAEKLPGIEAKKLFLIWKEASKIIPLVNTFHWVDWDFQWAVEGCFGQAVEDVSTPADGFHTVKHFITTRTMDGKDILNPEEYVARLLAGNLSDEITPVAVADQLSRLANGCIEKIEGMEQAISDPDRSLVETLNTIMDIRSMSYLGLYYAQKIRASTALELYHKTGNRHSHQLAVTQLEQALVYWQHYTDINRERYKPQVLARPGLLDLEATSDAVLQDIEIARKFKTQYKKN